MSELNDIQKKSQEKRRLLNIVKQSMKDLNEIWRGEKQIEMNEVMSEFGAVIVEVKEYYRRYFNGWSEERESYENLRIVFKIGDKEKQSACFGYSGVEYSNKIWLCCGDLELDECDDGTDLSFIDLQRQLGKYQGSFNKVFPEDWDLNQRTRFMMTLTRTALNHSSVDFYKIPTGFVV